MDGQSRLSVIFAAVLGWGVGGTAAAQTVLVEPAQNIQVYDFTTVIAGQETVVLRPSSPPLEDVPEFDAAESGSPLEEINSGVETASHTRKFIIPTAESCDSDGRFMGCTDAYGFDPAGYRFSWTPDKWAKVGAAIRTSFTSQNSNQVGGGGNYFTIDNARLLTTGQVTKYIGYELNSDVSLASGATPDNLRLPSSIRLLDAIAKFETGGAVNFWAGQFLPPADRSTIDGPFFINGWDFPFVSNYPAIFQGRQIGAAYWGQIQGGRLKWSIGAFNGTGATLQSPYSAPLDVPPNTQGNIQFDGRVTLNLLDPEPGYYHQSSYYGQKDILAIGYAIQMQKNATGTDADPHDFFGMNVDALFEKKLSNNGVFTLEGAAYWYNDQDLSTSGRQGTSGFVYCAYLFPYVLDLGPAAGRFRPYFRYQQYDYDFMTAANGQYRQGVDVGTEYVLNGPNARLTAVWSERDIVAGNRLQIFRIGAQVVF